MGVEVDALFITALLTVMGFSVHDTIVVFDRLRENLRFRKDGEQLGETVDHALNQTMARSINTSLSVLITTVALLLFGALSLKDVHLGFNNWYFSWNILFNLRCKLPACILEQEKVESASCTRSSTG